MPRKFRSGGRSPLNPWFRVGEFDVTTTVLVIAAGVLSFIIYAIDKFQFRHLYLSADKIQHGEIWRIVTWPLVNTPSFWSLITLVFLYIFGRQVEAEMGRFKFAAFIGWITVVPALIVTALSLEPRTGDAIVMIEVGVFVAFAAEFPGARFFFNISA
ncbi:MAG TPA: rhomboid family intramembrane serine protease, partial [Ilumatobacter sp.]|nr:rhomboid family intramembrane serine protease [Ilumatobacter sp.]